MKRAIVSVTNDLTTDQRVHKVCLLLNRIGFEVILIGRKRINSISIEKRPYNAIRMNLLFEKGFLFYAEYNMRLFFYLLTNKMDLLVSNDLDTLTANFLVAKLKRIPLVYDTHEYFTEVPELKNRPFVKQVWEAIERFIFPKLKYVFTVNDSIAQLYKNKYGNDVKVVRNIPDKLELQEYKTKKELGLPEDKKIIILQGAGINIDRGLEEAIQSMQYVDNVLFLIIGGGDVVDVLKKMASELNLTEKVKFINKLPYKELRQYTCLADLGLTLDKNTNLNYYYSLPNKLFDYIHSEIPVLASDTFEVAKIIKQYNIGDVVNSHDPKHIAEKINSMLNDTEKNKLWKENLKLAANQLSWENEEKVLVEIYSQFK